MTQAYRPEGLLLDTAENKQALRGISALREAMEQQTILEARALVCDSARNLIVDLNGSRGVIPRLEAAMGIREGTTRDIAIISRVGKPVSFLVTGFSQDTGGNPVIQLSRRRLQERCQREYLDLLTPGDVIPARITHLESFGSFVDIGCGVTSLIPIDASSVSRIAHPRDRFRNGQDILAVVKSIGGDRRITLSHKELLGSWEENAALFSAGETVAGVIRSVEKYGVFVELTPNLAGLAEPRGEVAPGQHASVYIKNLLPEKMKVKLIIIDAFDADYPPKQHEYYISGGHIRRWRYSPPSCHKVVETVFDP